MCDKLGFRIWTRTGCKVFQTCSIRIKIKGSQTALVTKEFCYPRGFCSAKTVTRE